MQTAWYTTPLPRRAPPGGLVDPLNGRDYRGGELLPFYVPRPLMPQVDESMYPALARFAHGKGIEFGFAHTNPNTLRAHQRVDKFHAERMDDQILAKPVLISADRYVLDGNHRWFAHIRYGLDWIDALRIGLPFEEAIGLLFDFPGTYTLANHEETN